MAKKFGKFLLTTAAIAAAAAGAYYYIQKKGIKLPEFNFDFDDDDFDEFDEDEDFDELPRSYVTLTPNDDFVVEETGADAEEGDELLFEEAGASESDFIPLAEQLAEKKDEQIEEFFDEEA